MPLPADEIEAPSELMTWEPETLAEIPAEFPAAVTFVVVMLPLLVIDPTASALMPVALFPPPAFVVMLPLLVIAFPLAVAAAEMPTRPLPLIEIVPVLLFKIVELVPAAVMPAAPVPPDVPAVFPPTIVPLLVICALFPAEEMPMELVPVVAMVPLFVRMAEPPEDVMPFE
jgi:hypothetical protein